MVLLAGHWRNSLTVCLCLPGVAVCIIGLLWGRSHHFYRQQVMGGYSARHLEKYLISHFKPLNPRRVSTGTMRNNIIIAIDLFPSSWNRYDFAEFHLSTTTRPKTPLSWRKGEWRIRTPGNLTLLHYYASRHQTNKSHTKCLIRL